ncbi:MAG: hypothetical protein ACR2KJ_08885 [Jatrophihabitans sp.]
MMSQAPDAAVAAAVISSSAALLVAIVSGAIALLRAGFQRRYQRRYQALVDAQDAMVMVRTALREYGQAAAQAAQSDPVGPGARGPQRSFAWRVPGDRDEAQFAARTQLEARLVRVERVVADSVGDWYSVAQEALLAPGELMAGDEDAAFHDTNQLIGAAIRSRNGLVPSRFSPGSDLSAK